MLGATKGLQLPLRDSQQANVVCWCRRCNGEVYEDETLYIWEGKRICVDCFKAKITSWMEEAPGEVAAALDIDTVTV